MPGIISSRGSYPHDTPLGRLSVLINHLCNELTNAEYQIPTVAKALAEEAALIINGLDPYLTNMTSPHPPILDKMIKAGNETDWKLIHEQGKTKFELIPEMTAGSYEAVVLQQLAKTAKAKTILEIGMFTGTTTVSLALLPSVAKVVTLELEGFLQEFNDPYFTEAGVSAKIDIRIGDAQESLDQLVKECASFDMVFIDADKPGYSAYLHKVLDGDLLAPGGIVVADNTAYRAAPWAPDPSSPLGSAIHAFNKDVRDDPRIEVVMLPIRDGISLIRRRGE